MSKALYEFLTDEFGVKTTIVENPVVSQVATTVTQVFSSNPNRLALVIINLGAKSVYVAPSRDPSANKGIFLGASGGSMTLKWNEDFELVSHDWHAIAIGAASNVYCLEVVST